MVNQAERCLAVAAVAWLTIVLCASPALSEPVVLDDGSVVDSSTLPSDGGAGIPGAVADEAGSAASAENAGVETDQQDTNTIATAVSRLRDPFWPVGYRPKEMGGGPKKNTVIAKPGVVDWGEAQKRLTILGIMEGEGGRLLVLVNEQVVGEGDHLTYSFRGHVYSWLVRGVGRDYGLKLQKASVRPMK